ncbi:MAG TPA: FeoB-associated Cys-rich membrane protein [Tahibacter sp.]|nr:FeoB-associated Cys-rich membrane protein [Tahibacter sp.]
MNTNLAIQYGIIGLAVAASVWYTARKYWPRSSAKSGACGSSDGGCSTCGACSTQAQPVDEVMPLAPPKPLRR